MDGVDKRAVLRQRSIDKEKQKAERKKFITDNLRKILKKEVENRTKDDKELLEQHKTLAKKINKNILSREEKEDRKREWEDEVEVLQANGATTLVDLAVKAGLADTLTGDGELTVFAPTNDAFAALPDQRLLQSSGKGGSAGRFL